LRATGVPRLAIAASVPKAVTSAETIFDIFDIGAAPVTMPFVVAPDMSSLDSNALTAGRNSREVRRKPAWRGRRNVKSSIAFFLSVRG
jgi:hypothetical protein